VPTSTPTHNGSSSVVGTEPPGMFGLVSGPYHAAVVI
jgi:hypothetical protein